MKFSRKWPVIISESWIWEGRIQNLDMGTLRKMKTGAHKYSPYIDEDEKNKVQETMEREKENEDMIR